MKAEKKSVLNLLNNAKGNLEAVIEMMQQERYCIDVSHQILAVQALLKKANIELIKQHLHHCVVETFQQDNSKDKQIKIDEIAALLKKVGV